MIFQKTSFSSPLENSLRPAPVAAQSHEPDEVETVVGPSVNVEGDFASEGNIIVKGSVAGSVRTSRHLAVEAGAKILANVRAASAKISGEVRGNMKIKDLLELTSTARVLGDVEVKTLMIEGGAIVCGKIMMPGLEGVEPKSSRPARSVAPMVKRNEEALSA